VEFDASASSSGLKIEEPDCSPKYTDLPITSYVWDFHDGSSAGSGEKVDHTYVSPGNFEVKLTVTDSAPGGHNTDTSTMQVAVYDTTPPDTAIDGGPTGTITDSKPVFTFHSSEVQSTFECSIDAGVPSFASCSGPTQDTPAGSLAPGLYTFRVRATDRFGNPDPTPAVREFTIASPSSGGGPGGGVASGSAPDTVLSLHPKPRLKTHGRARVHFAFSSTVDGASFECQLDGGAFAACASPKSYSVKPGRHSFSVRAVVGGTQDPTPASYAFKVVKKHRH
jgi:PKD repeat protein